MKRDSFDFAPPAWLPVQDKAVLKYCRSIKREDMEYTNENGYSVRVVPHPCSAIACELFDRIYKSDVEDKKTVIVFPNSWKTVYTAVAEMCNKFNVSARNLHCFCMDEYADEDIDFIEFLGYKNSIDMGVSSIEDIYKIVYRDDIDILIDELDRYVDGISRLIECDIRLLRKDGSQIYTRIKAKALDTLNDSDEIIGTATDVSDHQNYVVQRALTDAIMLSSINGIMICDASGNILDINDSFSQITGYSKEEVIGKKPQILRSDRHDNVFYAKMWSDIKHFGSWSGKIYNKNRAGQIYLEHLVITAVKDEHDIIQRYIASFYKIME